MKDKLREILAEIVSKTASTESDFYEGMTLCDEATDQILTLFRDSLPKEKDTMVYYPMEDGTTRANCEECAVGYNTCLAEIKEVLK